MNDIIADFYFQSPVYRQHLPKFLDDCLAVFDEKIEFFKQQDSFELDPFYPSITTDNLIDDRLDNFCTHINQAGWNILNSQGFDVDSFETYSKRVWGQLHYKYSSMEYHYHPECVLTGFYILSAPSNSSEIYFHDPRTHKHFDTQLPIKNTKEINQASRSVFYKPKDGDLFITNSWLPHSFTRNKSEQPLKFIHFCIYCDYVEKSKTPIIL